MNTFPDMQASGGTLVKPRGGDEGVMSNRGGKKILNVSVDVSVGVLHPWLTPRVPEDWAPLTKDLELKKHEHYLFFLLSHLPHVTLQVFFTPHNLPADRRVPSKRFTVQCLTLVDLLLLVSSFLARLSVNWNVIQRRGKSFLPRRL